MRAMEITPDMVNATIDYLMVQDVPKKKEHTMSYVNAQIAQVSSPSESEQQRDYFLERLRHLAYEKDRAAEKHFGLLDDPRPSTAKELIKRIKDGKFYIEKDHEDKEAGVYYILDFFKWRDPDLKKDQEGYSATRELIAKAVAEAEDEIWNDSKNALKAIHKFESKSFH